MEKIRVTIVMEYTPTPDSYPSTDAPDYALSVADMMAIDRKGYDTGAIDETELITFGEGDPAVTWEVVPGE